MIDIQETLNTTEVLIDENATEFDIEYETPGPVAFEKNISGGKEIVISSEVHYENILVYTELPWEVPASAMKLYWITEKNLTESETAEQCISDNETNEVVCENVTTGEIVIGITDVREEVNANKYDLDNNSLIDYIEWVVPSLSNQTYEVIIGDVSVGVKSTNITAENNFTHLEVNDSSLVLFMDFNIEDISNVTYDLTGNDNDGTLGNATVSTHPVWNSTGGFDGEGAYEFDGVDDYVNLDYSKLVDLDTATVTGWFKKKTSVREHLFVLGDADTSYNEFAIDVDTNNELGFAIKDNNFYHINLDVDSPTISTDTWYHFAIVSGVGGNKIYLDGNLIDSGDITYANGNAANEACMNDSLDITNALIGARDIGGTTYDTYFNGTTTPSGKLHVNTTGNANALVVNDSTGNVGIGTASPEANLAFKPAAYTASVEGIKFQNAADEHDAIIQSFRVAAGSLGIGLYLGSNSYLDTGGITQRFDTGEESAAIFIDRDGVLEFWTGDNTGSASERMTIKNSGSVGIGTTAPARKLEVAGSTGMFMSYDPTHTSDGTFAFIPGASGGTSQLIASYWGGTPPNFEIKTYGNDGQLFLKTDGNVGIGTTTPQNTLNVIGGLNATTNSYFGQNVTVTGCIVFASGGSICSGS